MVPVIAGSNPVRHTRINKMEKKKYKKPYIEIVGVVETCPILISGNGKYRYIRDSNGETIESDFNERQSPSWEKFWKGMNGHGYDPNGNQMFSKKNNLWE